MVPGSTRPSSLLYLILADILCDWAPLAVRDPAVVSGYPLVVCETRRQTRLPSCQVIVSSSTLISKINGWGRAASIWSSTSCSGVPPQNACVRDPTRPSFPSVVMPYKPPIELLSRCCAHGWRQWPVR